jgi:hypothetical protein
MEVTMSTTSTTSISIKKEALEWLESAPVTWFYKVANLPDDKRTDYLFELDSWLVSITVRAARLGGYIDAVRKDQKHAKAVEYSNKLVARVRKALGYTIAKDDLRF